MNENDGAAPSVTVTLDVIVTNATAATDVPPIDCARRFTVCTAGVPPGCVALSVTASAAVPDAAGTLIVLLYPPSTGPNDAVAARCSDGDARRRGRRQRRGRRGRRRGRRTAGAARHRR